MSATRGRWYRWLLAQTLNKLCALIVPLQVWVEFFWNWFSKKSRLKSQFPVRWRDFSNTCKQHNSVMVVVHSWSHSPLSVFTVQSGSALSQCLRNSVIKNESGAGFLATQALCEFSHPATRCQYIPENKLELVFQLGVALMPTTLLTFKVCNMHSLTAELVLC